METSDLPAHESSVVRYYTSPLLLRVLDPLAHPSLAHPSLAPLGTTASAPFLSIADAHFIAPLLLRAPSVVVVPPTDITNGNTNLNASGNESSSKVTSGVFTILPAEGFVKEPGEPVYYNDPIQLQDQHGRVLGIASRAPCAGHLAADGHHGALVFVLERPTARRHSPDATVFRRSLSGHSSDASTAGSDDPSRSFNQTTPPPRRSSLVQVCGGDRLRIPGLMRVAKKQYPGDCILQPKRDDARRRSSRTSTLDDDPPYLTCEVVLTTAAAAPSPSPHRRDSASSTASSTVSAKRPSLRHVADRTATGEYVGVLHSGILHRRSDHLKLWKKRFFVLTQVALHRFDVRETLATVPLQPAPRCSIYLRDCLSVRYERFSRPHELEIALTSGKVFSLHAVDALTCSEWASVLSRAIERPQWVHTEHNYLTAWRSDGQFESPQCPAITKVVLRRHHNKQALLECCGELSECNSRVRQITTTPRWNEKLSLGSVTAAGYVLVHLADGNVFRLTLDDLARALVQPRWMAVSTSLEVARIQALDDEDEDVPHNISRDVAPRKSETGADKSSFIVRLKFQADVQLDQRLKPKLSLDTERTIVLGIFSGLVLLPAIGYGYAHARDAVAQYFCLVSASLLAVALVLLAPVAWQVYLWIRYADSMEGQLHWFITLLALEMRPQSGKSKGSDRDSTASSSESARRSRLESFIDADDDDDDSDQDAASVVPAKTPLVSLEKTPSHTQLTARVSLQAIRAFRLENALDAILARPLLSFFAIKEYFPSTFLPRDAQGRRVLLISLNQMDRTGLIRHNVSSFNVVRYFLYVWEFMWSYQDVQERVGHSQLVVVVDCTGWPYFKWFSIECQMLLLLLNTTSRFYPNRLARVIFTRNHVSFGVYEKLFRKGLDPDVRDLVETCRTLPPFVQDALDSDSKASDETALEAFVTGVLATHANEATPTFTPRELAQATRFTTTGSLHADDASPSLDEIGTLAVVVPPSVASMTWQTVVDKNGFTMWKAADATASNPVASVTKGHTYQSDARAMQWRGRYVMKATNADHVVKELQDPQSASLWMEGTDNLTVLDTLSQQEDLCFWSRRVPFMSFSRSGYRGQGNGLGEVQRNAYFHCVIRRIHAVTTGAHPFDRVATVMWKTPSAQHVVVDNNATQSDKEEERGGGGTDDPRVQWRKLEDPFVSLCYVVEEQTAIESPTKTVTLSFWFQSFSPPTTPRQDAEIAYLIARKFRALDDVATQGDGPQQN